MASLLFVFLLRCADKSMSIVYGTLDEALQAE